MNTKLIRSLEKISKLSRIKQNLEVVNKVGYLVAGGHFVTVKTDLEDGAYDLDDLYNQEKVGTPAIPTPLSEKVVSKIDKNANGFIDCKFVDILKKLAKFTSSDRLRSVCIQKDFIVATDARILCVKDFDNSKLFEGLKKEGMLVPFDAINRFPQYGTNVTWKVAYSQLEYDSYLVFRDCFDSVTFYIQLLSGNYPNWRNVIPNLTCGESIIPDVINMIKFPKGKNYVTFSNGKVSFKSSDNVDLGTFDIPECELYQEFMFDVEYIKLVNKISPKIKFVHFGCTWNNDGYSGALVRVKI